MYSLLLDGGPRGGTIRRLQLAACEHGQPGGTLDSSSPPPGRPRSPQVTGIDLSAYMLSVAELRERQWEAARKQQLRGRKEAVAATASFQTVDGSLLDPSLKRRRIRYAHANVENAGFPDAAFDLVAPQVRVCICIRVRMQHGG